MIKPLALILLYAAFASTAAAEGADAAKGKLVASQVCVACHGPDGNSPAAIYPSLAGQHASYLLKQLKNFKARDGKPAERVNPVMAAIVANLSDDDMANVAAHYASQKPQPTGARDKNLAEKGRKLYRAGDGSKGLPACAACHSPSGAGIAAQFPRLAGQHQAYTEAQLATFKSGARANDAQSMMRTIAARVTDDEAKALAEYLAGLR